MDIPENAVDLAERRLFGSGGSVVLYWHPSTDKGYVQVIDGDQDFVIEAEPATMMDTFQHPYLYGGECRCGMCRPRTPEDGWYNADEAEESAERIEA